jgi:hypothetical protein
LFYEIDDLPLASQYVVINLIRNKFSGGQIQCPVREL